MEKVNNIEKNNKTIKESLNVAYSNPIKIQEIKELEEKMKDNNTYFEEQRNFIKKIKNSIAEFKTIKDFKEACKILGLDNKKKSGYKNFTEYIIAHENAHLNIAEKEGQIIHGYWFIFIEDEEGEIIMQPAAGYELLDNLSNQELLEIEKRIINAPHEYGNELSLADKYKLDFLETTFK